MNDPHPHTRPDAARTLPPAPDDPDRLLLHADLDGELDPAASLALARRRATDPAFAAEAERIAALPPALQGAAVGEFAASVNRAPRPSTAPPPGRAVTGMRPPSSGAPSSSSMEDYAVWRSRQKRA